MVEIENQEISIEIRETSRLKGLDPADLQFGKDFTDHMFIADYKDGNWNDFRIIPYGEIPMSPATCALHYGQSVFEGMKAFKGKDGKVRLFRPLKNANRLNMSAKRLCMPEFPVDMFMSSLKELVRLDSEWVPKMNGCSLYLRPFIFASEAFLGVRPGKEYKFMILCSPAARYYSEPVKVRVEYDYTRAAKGGVGHSKAAGNYAAAMYPTYLANKDGYHQLIWTDGQEHKYVEEAGTMNLMFQIGDTLVTPSLETGTILAGITRDSVIEVAKDLGYKVEERRVGVEELIQAYEKGELNDAFGLGTAADIAPIASITIGDQVMELPPLEDRHKSSNITKTLSDIKYGEVEDKFGWIEEV